MNEIKLTGKIIKKLEPVTGTSAKGQWNKQEFVIETTGDYPKKVCISVWNDTIDYLDKAQEGDEVELSVDITSREYNDRYYTDVKAWKIEVKSTAHTDVNKDTGEISQDHVSATGIPEDDLPF